MTGVKRQLMSLNEHLLRDAPLSARAILDGRRFPDEPMGVTVTERVELWAAHGSASGKLEAVRLKLLRLKLLTRQKTWDKWVGIFFNFGVLALIV